MPAVSHCRYHILASEVVYSSDKGLSEGVSIHLAGDAQLITGRGYDPARLDSSDRLVLTLSGEKEVCSIIHFNSMTLIVCPELLDSLVVIRWDREAGILTVLLAVDVKEVVSYIPEGEREGLADSGSEGQPCEHKSLVSDVQAAKNLRYFTLLYRSASLHRRVLPFHLLNIL